MIPEVIKQIIRDNAEEIDAHFGEGASDIFLEHGMTRYQLAELEKLLHCLANRG